MEVSGGYDQRVILDRMIAARKQVQSGEAIFERDGVVFNDVSYSWPLITGLLCAVERDSKQNKGELRVLDFGGSLGTSFFQNLDFLSEFISKWGVVEQPHFVAAGQTLGEDDRLTFHESIESCIREINPNVALISGVIHCLPDPFRVLDQIIQSGIGVVILDRVPFLIDGMNDLICVQVVPESIYPATYPIRVFARKPFYDRLSVNYHINSHFDALDGQWSTLKGTVVSFEGAIMTLKQ